MYCQGCVCVLELFFLHSEENNHQGIHEDKPPRKPLTCSKQEAVSNKLRKEGKLAS